MVSKIGIILIVFCAGTFAIPAIPLEVQAVNANDFEQTNRIEGGDIAADGNFPYVAALSTGWIFRSLVCGGSLITERHVLTAAHCVDASYSFGSLSWSLRITVGTNRWKRDGQMYSVSHNITHQHYDPVKIKNDIGLLVTRSKVQLSRVVVPVSLSFEFVGAGVTTRATGWGRTKFMGPTSDNLRQLTIDTIDGQQCVDQVAAVAAELGVTAPSVDPDIELCTLHSPNHGLCNGDSGSALVVLASGQQVGVVSWGLPCARGAPDVFLRVSAFRDWLLQNVDQ